MSWAGRVWRAITGGADPAPAKPRRQPAPPRPAAKYDAAQTAAENRDHWRGADGLSAAAANSPDVRYKLRTRSRYETLNNGYGKGLVRGRANDTIGVCPMLQLSLPERATDPDFQTEVAVNPDAARAVERLWAGWVDRVALADKLRLMDKAETREGEAFGVQVSNPALHAEAGGPELDLRLYETDQCCTPDLDAADPLAADGIRFDRAGNPVEYHFLDRHPGDGYGGWLSAGAYTRVPARQVHHLHDPERIGEARSVPAVTPALPLYNQGREYTLATLGTAKLQASISGVIESEAGPADDSDEPPEIETMDAVPVPRDALLTMPGGATAKPFNPSQPTTGYKEFKGELLAEAGRSIGAPRNVSTGSSAEYNYSSGRLDHLPYQNDLRIRRDRTRRIVLDPLFRAWAFEASLIPGYLPAGLPPLSEWRVTWRWDGFPSIDPVKDATAAEIRQRAGHTTLERECAERGDDWEEVLEQQAREAAKRKALGLAAPAPPAGFPAPEKEAAPDAA